MHRTVSTLTWRLYEGANYKSAIIGASAMMLSQPLQVRAIVAVWASDAREGCMHVIVNPRSLEDSEINEYALKGVLECLGELNPVFPENFSHNADILIRFPKRNAKKCGHAAAELFLQVVNLLGLIVPDDKLPIPEWKYELFEQFGEEWLLPGEALATRFYPERIKK